MTNSTSPERVSVTDEPLDLSLETETDRSDAQLYVAFLELLREGRSHLDELADSLELSAIDTERICRAAEQRGDATRDGYTGQGLYTIRVTEQGLEKLPPLSRTEERLAEHDLAVRDLDVLRVVDEVGRSTTSTILAELDDSLTSVSVVPSVTHLVRQGYLDESGLLRRYVELTDDGRAVLEAIDAEES